VSLVTEVELRVFCLDVLLLGVWWEGGRGEGGGVGNEILSFKNILQVQRKSVNCNKRDAIFFKLWRIKGV
jgi:hypothetical protein